MNPTTWHRVAILSIGVGLMATAIGARLIQLQVLQRESFSAQACDQHWQEITVPAVRGAILDRTGRELAVSVEVASLYAHPPRVVQTKQVASALASALGCSAAQIEKRLRSDRPFVYLQRFLDLDTAQAVRELDLADSECRLKYFIDRAGTLSYDPLFRNCEHFARFVVEGKRQSMQVHTVVGLGILAVAVAFWNRAAA